MSREQEEEEEMEFVIIRDVTPTSEWDEKSTRSSPVPDMASVKVNIINCFSKHAKLKISYLIIKNQIFH